MKVLPNLIFVLVVFLFCAAAASAQQPAAKKIYQNIEVEKFTIQPGVEYPADKINGLTKSIVDNLISSKRFTQISLSENSALEKVEPTESLKISGEIIKYTKGSRALRYIVGEGAGATIITAYIKFTDITTGQLIHQQAVESDVSIGLFGGSADDVKSGIADEIIRVMRKNGLAGEKMKK